MKKFKSAALAFALAASLIGCSAAPSETPETNRKPHRHRTPLRRRNPLKPRKLL